MKITVISFLVENSIDGLISDWLSLGRKESINVVFAPPLCESSFCSTDREVYIILVRHAFFHPVVLILHSKVIFITWFHGGEKNAQRIQLFLDAKVKRFLLHVKWQVRYLSPLLAFPTAEEQSRTWLQITHWMCLALSLAEDNDMSEARFGKP